MGLYDNRCHFAFCNAFLVCIMVTLSYVYHGTHYSTILFALIQTATLVVGMNMAVCNPRAGPAIHSVAMVAMFGQMVQGSVYLIVHEWRYYWWAAWFILLIGGLAMAVGVGVLLKVYDALEESQFALETVMVELADRSALLEKASATLEEIAAARAVSIDDARHQDQGDAVDPDTTPSA